METILNTNIPVVPTRNQGKVLVHKSTTADAPLPLQKPQASNTDIQNKINRANAHREQAIRRAAADTFVVSDQSFTIYKDISGQFVTRFTSLRDGRVTYIPEPDVLSWLKQSSGSHTATLSLEV